MEGEHVERCDKNVRTLQDTLKQNDFFFERFKEAIALSKSIFEEKNLYTHIPFFTDHGVEHAEQIEDYLNQIIWPEGIELTPQDFIPSPEEAMYLLSAAWLHDIGMMYGLFEEESQPDRLQDLDYAFSLREEHELRTSRYIIRRWRDNCHWKEEEKALLANICFFHRQKNPIVKCTLDKISKYDKKYIRCIVLASLLRLADACHVDQSRAPGPLKYLYKSVGMSDKELYHWERAELIGDIRFSRENKSIIICGDCPPKIDTEELFTFDLQEIVEIIRSEVDKELRSVEQVLLRYTNTHFTKVVNKIDYMPALETQKEGKCLSLWPYLLNKTTSSTETAAAFCKIINFTINEIRPASECKKYITKYLKQIQTLRPCDLLIRNLCLDIHKQIDNEELTIGSLEKLSTKLENLISEMTINCRKMADFAKSLIQPKDVLIIHGYSTNVARLLKSLKGQYSNKLYIIDCEKISTNPFEPDENIRMIEYSRDLGFEEVTFVQFSALPSLFRYFRDSKINCKLLLGTHGKLKGQDFLCKPGSSLIVSSGKEFGITTIIFSEERKFLTNGKTDEEIANYSMLFNLDMTSAHQSYNLIKRVKPIMDRIPISSIDIIITEKGALLSQDFIATHAPQSAPKIEE